jgi:uncharacterized phage protein (TIGR02218 family)
MTRPATQALKDYLSSNNDAVVIDLYTFAFRNGMTLRYSGGNFPVTVAGNFFPGSPLNYDAAGGLRYFTLGPKFGRSKAKFQIGVQPNSMDIIIVPDPTYDKVGTYPWQDGVRWGLFDGCQVELDRLILPMPFPGPQQPLDTSLGAIPWFFGVAGQLESGRSHIKMEVLSELTHIVQRQMPRRMYQTGCTHVFGDAMCQFDRTSMAATVTCSQSTLSSTIVCGLAPSPSNLYDLGTAIGLTGQNAALKADIQTVVDGIVWLSFPFVWPITLGDTFQLLPGCDHSPGTCTNTFNNFAHYGGFDYIPPPEAAI